MCDSPEITVVTAVLNRAEMLVDTIESVLAQRQPSVEHVIVDGGSTDGTETVLEHYAARGIRFVSEPDEGIYDALNKGMRIAQGKYICTLHAGDIYLPGVMGSALDKIRSDPEAIWYSDCQIGSYYVRAPDTITPGILLFNLGIAHQSILAPRRAFGTPAYLPGFRIVSDYLWMRGAYLQGWTFRKFDNCHVHLEENGLSSGQTLESRQLFENEVAERTLLHFPFVPPEILQLMYRHRTHDESTALFAWVDQMETSDDTERPAEWTEFREALDDYIGRITAMREI